LGASLINSRGQEFDFLGHFGTFWDTFGTLGGIYQALVASERNYWPRKRTIRFGIVKFKICL
jgi:hypothetical protein